MVDFIQAFYYIQLENYRTGFVQPQVSMMNHISVTAYPRDLLQVLECSSLNIESLHSN